CARQGRQRRRRFGSTDADGPGKRTEAGHEMNAREKGLGAAALALCAVVMSAESLSAQAPAPTAGAPAQATPPAPRFPDGHVNLGSAPGQKGYWEVRRGRGGFPR